MSAIAIQRSNTILYCRHWQQTVAFYREGFGLRPTFDTDWFVELQVAPASFLSLADEARASIASAEGKGITLSWQVNDLRSTHETLRRAGLEPGPIRAHSWGAWICHLWDPEGHRIELWMPRAARVPEA